MYCSVLMCDVSTGWEIRPVAADLYWAEVPLPLRYCFAPYPCIPRFSALRIGLNQQEKYQTIPKTYIQYITNSSCAIGSHGSSLFSAT